MGKDKLRRFAENEQFENLFQPSFKEVFDNDFVYKGKWKREVFKNNNPIILELGCGRGEYTIGMGKENSNKNFIGIDIKGARLWRGAKTAIQEEMPNIAFIRTKIEVLNALFDKGEIDEIWITFPDPQLKPRRAKKRLTSSRFLNSYKNFLNQTGTINLKTDSVELHEYTSALLEYNEIEPIQKTSDLYNSSLATGVLNIKTHYETKFLEEGKKITYLKFKLPEFSINELEYDEVKRLAEKHKI